MQCVGALQESVSEAGESSGLQDTGSCQRDKHRVDRVLFRDPDGSYCCGEILVDHGNLEVPEMNRGALRLEFACESHCQIRRHAFWGDGATELCEDALHVRWERAPGEFRANVFDTSQASVRVGRTVCMSWFEEAVVPK